MTVLIERVLAGDRDAFNEWIKTHIRTIELLALQYGASPNEAAAVTESVVGDLSRRIGQITREQLEEDDLFACTINKLSDSQGSTTEHLFTFEEDNELFERIRGLRKELRLPLILFAFHGKTASAIAGITGATTEETEEALKRAFERIDEPDLEKKLEFLNRSFHRLPQLARMEDIAQTAAAEAPSSKKAEKHKRPVLAWGLGAGILVVMLLFMTITRSEAYQQSSAEKFIERSKISFEEELERNLTLAGLPMTVPTDRVYLETYGEETSRNFNLFVKSLESDVDSEGKIDKKVAKAEFGELMDELKMPSEMILELDKKPLVDDLEKSMEFANTYFGKMYSLLRSYQQIIWQHEFLIRGVGRNDEGGYNLDAFYAKKAEYPEELQLALDGMERQGVSFTSDESGGIYERIGGPELVESLRQNLHPDTGIYITILMGGLIDLHKFPVEKQADLLLQIEEGLLRAKGYDDLYNTAYSSYTWGMYALTGMVGQLEIYDSSGKVKEEYREAWKRIAENNESMPSSLIMKKIVEEMEQSNWLMSSYLEDLQYYVIETEVSGWLREMD